eukprot:2244371-Rhodomonas_salina.1
MEIDEKALSARCPEHSSLRIPRKSRNLWLSWCTPAAGSADVLVATLIFFGALQSRCTASGSRCFSLNPDLAQIDVQQL